MNTSINLPTAFLAKNNKPYDEPSTRGIKEANNKGNQSYNIQDRLRFLCVV